MSVLIKSMDMPKGCATCPYCDRAWNKPKCKAKSVQGRFLDQRLNLDRTRQKWCPLVPVLPHGRLIDADELFRKIKAECNPYGNPTIGYEDGLKMLRIIENSPTIIPAEEATT